MAANYLGLYLLHKGVITEEQLFQGLEYQERINRRIGGLAVDAGLMTTDQTDRIFVRQAEDDRPFGEIAVAECMLSRPQLDDLLFRQRVTNVYLGESLLQLGFLDADIFSELMDEYYSLERKRSEAVSSILTGIDDYKVVLSLMQAAQKTFVRFVDRNVKLLPEAEVIQAGPDTVCMRFTSRVQGGCAFVFSFLLCPGAAHVLGALPDNGNIVGKDNGTACEKFFRILEGYLRAALAERNCTLEDCQVEQVGPEEWNAMHGSDMTLDVVTPGGRQAMVVVSRPE